MTRRAWAYQYRRWLPGLGEDEHGRRTLIIPLVPGLFCLIIALRSCGCSVCRALLPGATPGREG